MIGSGDGNDPASETARPGRGQPRWSRRKGDAGNPEHETTPEQDQSAFPGVDAGESKENPMGHVVSSFHGLSLLQVFD